MFKKILIGAMAVSVAVGFAACNNNAKTEEKKVEESITETESFIDEVDVSYFDPAGVEGEYQDSTSQRATMVIYYVEPDNNYSIKVNWADSATEDNEWYMTAVDDGQGRLVYTDEECKHVKYTSDTEYTDEIIYEGKEGYFTFEDGKFLWDGAYQESCRECLFERAE